MIGIGAILLQGSEIGQDCIIAAGSLVSPNTMVPDRSLYMGNPARFKEQLSEERFAELQVGTEVYSELAAQYREMEYKEDYSK